MIELARRIHRMSQPFAVGLDMLRDLLLLAIRVYIAWVFFKSGLTKIDDWDTTLMLFTDEYQVPFLSTALAAFMGTAGELLLPPLLVLGLTTRFAALGLFVVNAMAVISYPALFEFSCPAALQSHYFWGALIAVLACCGAGRVSVDWWASRRLQTY